MKEQATQNAITEEYYNQTEWDYRTVWSGEEVVSMHFGLYEGGADNHYRALTNTNRVIARTVDITREDYVLDAGCGLGGTSFWLAENVGCKVTGISITPSQIAACKKTATELKLTENTDFTVGDFTAIPYPDNHFDVVISCEAMCYAIDKTDFYREAYRVLKPGGRLVISDTIRAEKEFTPEEEELYQRWLSGPVIPNLASPSEHQRKAESVGFTSFKYEDYTDAVRVSIRNLHEKCRRIYPIAWVLWKMGFRSDMQQANVRGGIDYWKTLELGLWSYGVLSARKD